MAGTRRFNLISLWLFCNSIIIICFMSTNKYNLRFKALAIILFTTCKLLFSQQQYHNSFLKLSFGYSLGLMHQQNNNNFKNTMNGINLGFISTKKIKEKYSFNFGIYYSVRNTSNYINSINHISNWSGGPEITKVNLKTSLNLEYIELPLFIKRHFKNKYSLGLGLNLSYLINAKLNQEVLGKYAVDKYPLADDDFTASIKYVYGIKNYQSTSAFTKGNFAPFFNFGLALNDRLDIEYFIGYDIIANPKLEYKFNDYNLFNNNIVLTFKLKKQ